MAELPFRDNSFDSVFHIGGINFFNNQQKAIEEMIRVAKPGTKLIICDENESGAQWYEKFLPGFKGAFHGTPDGNHCTCQSHTSLNAGPEAG